MSETKTETGHISIHTENILPIIKKWLYSEKEIFLREIISNAHDAITKMQTIAASGDYDGDFSEGRINIAVDEQKKTITVSDNGLGLTADEVKKYINQVAFSGAEDFIKKFEKASEDKRIIGSFGLGFYSSFMVSDRVTIKTLSYQPEATSVFWESDGSTTYTLSDSDRGLVGTDITMHLGEEDAKEYALESKVREIVRHYSNFLPIQIFVNDTLVNDTSPLWAKKAADCTEEEYKEFYHKLFPGKEDPLFWIHLNVDHPFNLKGILYFPKISHEMEYSEGNIKLFANQVFVSDNNSQDMIPKFLTLLQGVMDCPDIPLNVSRSYLQNDPYVSKISKYITRKVSDKLKDLYKKDQEAYRGYWEDINPFIKYGIISDSKFAEKTKDIVIYRDTAGAYHTLTEYQEKYQAQLEKKVLYVTDETVQAVYVKMVQKEGLEAVVLPTMIDAHFISYLERENKDVTFARVDAEMSEILKESAPSEIVDPSDNKTPSQKLLAIFEEHVQEEGLELKVESLKDPGLSGVVLVSEHSRRFKEMASKMGGAFGGAPGFKEHTLVVNANSEISKRILALRQEIAQDSLIENLCRQVYDLARLSQGDFSPEQMLGFIERSNQLLAKV